MSKKVLIGIGTRPEAIKMASVISGLHESDLDCKVLNTGQHADLMQPIFDLFNIAPDYELEVMEKSQTLASVTEKILRGTTNILEKYQPDVVCVQGDTTTCFTVALAAFYVGIPIAHVEAGLRSWNLQSPWPEEANRKLTDAIASLHFAPTENSMVNLIQDGASKSTISITGNTGIDALLKANEMIDSNGYLQDKLLESQPYIDENVKTILVTMHRRENIGKNISNICEAIKNLNETNPNINFVIPIHPNPRVNENVLRELSNQDGIHLIKPQGYLEFLNIMKNSYLIMTDSGGVQEEAPSLNKPVLVARDTTERPEGIDAGCATLVGTDTFDIVKEVQSFLDDNHRYNKSAAAPNPYGDGKASERIVKGIDTYFDVAGSLRFNA